MVVLSGGYHGYRFRKARYWQMQQRKCLRQYFYCTSCLTSAALVIDSVAGN